MPFDKAAYMKEYMREYQRSEAGKEVARRAYLKRREKLLREREESGWEPIRTWTWDEEKKERVKRERRQARDERRAEILEAGEKECSHCGEVLPLSSFGKMRDWYHSRCKRCRSETRGKRRSKTPEQERAAHARQMENSPEKVRARRKVAKAIARGKIPPAKEMPCEGCGGVADHYHHEDYSKPLEVIPVCRSCHKGLHVEI